MLQTLLLSVGSKLGLQGSTRVMRELLGHLAKTMGVLLDHEIARLKAKVATIDSRAHVVEGVAAILDRLHAEVSAA